MHLQLLRIYQRQVWHACNAVILGNNDAAAGSPADGRDFDPARFWYGIQNLITGAGNLSKLLWGTGKDAEAKKRYSERQSLRDSLQVTDASPLRRVKIRNDYEHLDERLEEWWEKSTKHNVVPELIGPRGSVVGPGLGDVDTLRWFDPTTGDVIFWGNELNIHSALGEAVRIMPIAQTESAKPHWEPEDHQ